MTLQAEAKLPIEALFDRLGCTIRKSADLPDPSHLDPAEVWLLLKRYGVVALRGFDLDLEQFKIFTERFPSRFLTHFGAFAAPYAQQGPDDRRSAEGSGWIYLHGEMYYMPQRPDELWLYCTVPPSEGGETTLLDAPSFLKALSPSARALFEKKDRSKFSRRVPSPAHAAISRLRRWSLELFSLHVETDEDHAQEWLDNLSRAELSPRECGFVVDGAICQLRLRHDMFEALRGYLACSCDVKVQ